MKTILIITIMGLLAGSGYILLRNRNNLFSSKSKEIEYPNCFTKDKCAEMLTCEEAMYFLTHCGKKRLDRDKDGIPCETICKGQK